MSKLGDGFDIMHMELSDLENTIAGYGAVTKLYQRPIERGRLEVELCNSFGPYNFRKTVVLNGGAPDSNTDIIVPESS